MKRLVFAILALAITACADISAPKHDEPCSPSSSGYSVATGKCE